MATFADFSVCSNRERWSGLHVDHETIGRIGRHRTPPRRDQVGPRHRQQQQRHQPDRERDGLHDRVQRSSLHRRERESPRRIETGAVARGGDRAQQPVGDQREDRERTDESAQRDQTHLHVARGPQRERTERHDAERIAERGARARQAHVAPDHSDGRDVPQLHHRRQCEAGEQDHADRETLQRGPCGRLRQARFEQRRQQRDEREVCEIPEHHAEDRAADTDREELAHVRDQQFVLRDADTAHHRGRIEMPFGESPRRERDGERGEHRRQQRHQREESFGAVERIAHFGTTGLERLDLLAAHQALVEPRAIVRDLVGRARDQQPMRLATAVLDQLRRRQLVETHQDARREIDERHPAIGFERDQTRDREALVAEVDRIAHMRTQRREERRIDPHSAGRGQIAGLGIGDAWRIGNPQTAAQRIAARRCLDRTQLRGWLGLRVRRGDRERHARKGHGLGGRQPTALSLVGERRGDRLVRDQHHVGTEQLRRIALEPGAQPVDEEAHARHRADRDHERQHEEPQLAGTPVAAECAKPLADRVGRCTHWVISFSSRSNTRCVAPRVCNANNNTERPVAR